MAAAFWHPDALVPVDDAIDGGSATEGSVSSLILPRRVSRVLRWRIRQSEHGPRGQRSTDVHVRLVRITSVGQQWFH
jgi:hypothetical protein